MRKVSFDTLVELPANFSAGWSIGTFGAIREFMRVVYHAPPGSLHNLRNQLRIAASALHFLDRHADEKLRWLIRIGRPAIHCAAACDPPVEGHHATS